MDDTIKVFKLNDCDWWAGSDLDSVVAAYKEQTGEDAELDNPHELNDAAMHKLKFVDGDDPINADGTPGGEITFRDELDIMIRRGDSFPCFFASTEW